MKEIITTIYLNIESFILSLGYFGLFFSSLLIIIDSIIPPVPLLVLIALNCMILSSKILALILSYISTVIGCYISYLIVKKLLCKPVTKFIAKRKNGDKVINFINKANLQNLSLIMAIPFAPAFLINIAAGLSEKLETKVFILSLLIGKFFMVFFWSYVGVSLKECITNPYVLIKVLLLIFIAYVISSILNKKLDLK